VYNTHRRGTIIITGLYLRCP